MQPVFRCPFETEGIQNGTIIDVLLGYELRARIEAIRAALRALYTDRSKTAVRLVLPERVTEQSRDNIDLVVKLVRYQCEYLAADLDVRLRPFLPFHPLGEYLSHRIRRARRFERLAAEALTHRLSKEAAVPRSVVHLAEALETIFRRQIARQGINPELRAGSMRLEGEERALLRMDLSAFETYVPSDALRDPARNLGLFTIVKTPFYPKQFGRYSERVEIIVTRHVDVNLLGETQRRDIRRAANEVHRRHGVPIAHYLQQQPTGLWIPEQPASVSKIF